MTDTRNTGQNKGATGAGSEGGARVYRHSDGYWTLSRYQDVAAALTDPRFSNRPAPFALLHPRNRGRYVAADVAANLIAFRDGANHMSPRRQLMAAFNALIDDCEPSLEGVAREVLDQIENKEHFDLVRDFCAPYAELACTVLVGFPRQDSARVARWSNDFFRLFHVSQDRETFLRVDERAAEFRAYVDAQLDVTPPGKTNSYISRLKALNTDAMTKRELADNVMLIASDAIENVRAGLAVAALALIERPDLLSRALAEGATMRAVIEESMRLESPGQFQGRITTEPVEIDGQVIPAHSLVLLSFASANRDPAAFSNPDTFDPFRREKRPLTFGGGPHACLGRMMVFKQLAVALMTLFGDNRQLVLVSAGPEWDERAGHRWMKTLAVGEGRT